MIKKHQGLRLLSQSGYDSVMVLVSKYLETLGYWTLFLW